MSAAVVPSFDGFSGSSKYGAPIWSDVFDENGAGVLSAGSGGSTKISHLHVHNADTAAAQVNFYTEADFLVTPFMVVNLIAGASIEIPGFEAPEGLFVATAAAVTANPLSATAFVFNP